MPKYILVYFKPGSTAPQRRMMLEVVDEKDGFLVAYKINKWAAAVECSKDKEVKHLIQKSAIKKIIPLEFNRHYGWLEEHYEPNQESNA